MRNPKPGTYRINREAVRRLRSKRPITDDRLAAKIDINVKTLRKWLNRGQPARLSNIIALAEALEVGDDYHTLILAEPEQPSPEPREPNNGVIRAGKPDTIAIPTGLCELRAVARTEWATMREFALNLQVKGMISSREQLVLLESIQQLVANELRKAGIAVTSAKSSLRVLSYAACSTERILLYVGGAGNDDTIDPWWQLLAIKPERLTEFLTVLRANKSSPQDLIDIESDFMSDGHIALNRYANGGAFGESLAFRVGTYATKPYDDDIQRAAEVFRFDPAIFWKVIYHLPESADKYRILATKAVLQ